jgi:hypothetical protein
MNVICPTKKARCVPPQLVQRVMPWLAGVEGLETLTPGFGVRAPRCCAVLDSAPEYGIVGEKGEGVQPSSQPLPARSVSSCAGYVQDWVRQETSVDGQ